MAPIRKPAVAGSWYPDDPVRLTAAVDSYLEAAGGSPPDLEPTLALIAPHAGLMYSGHVAAHAYRYLRHRRVDIIVLAGPSHFVGFDGVAIYARGGFDSPLGVAQIDEGCASELLRTTPVIREHETAHTREHSLEMQLPFVRRLAPDARIVPLVVGWQTEATARRLGDALASVLRGKNALLVASTDLSHYNDAQTAAAFDRVVIEHVERFDPDGLQRALDLRPEHACGGGPMVAVMRAARALGAREARVLKYADSGDISGDKSSVVGYLAAAFGGDAQPDGPDLGRS
jgi:AmmeMemoRadiSam system protein B